MCKNAKTKIFPMNKVSGFEIVERHHGYDLNENPLGMSVSDLMAQELRWYAEGVWHSRRCISGILGLELGDHSGLAIIESPYKEETNRAVIINADGSTRAALSPALRGGRMSFYDVVYMNSKLNFLAALNNDDCRVEVNEGDGCIIRVVCR